MLQPTITAAAAAVGIGEATLHRWLREPAFRAAYRQARRQSVESAVALLQCAGTPAVATLLRNLRCGKPAAEIRAATTILELSIKGVELADLVEEVENLKALFAAKEGKQQ